MKITNAGLHLVVGAVLGFLASFGLKLVPQRIIDQFTLMIMATIVFALACMIRELRQAKKVCAIRSITWEQYWKEKLLDSIMDVVFSVAAFFIIAGVFTCGVYQGNLMRP